MFFSDIVMACTPTQEQLRLGRGRVRRQKGLFCFVRCVYSQNRDEPMPCKRPSYKKQVPPNPR